MKNPEDLTRKQKRKLRAIEADNQVLYTSYLLKEQLRHTFAMKGKLSTYMLGAWLDWAEDSKIGPFVKVASSIRRTALRARSAARGGRHAPRTPV